MITDLTIANALAWMDYEFEANPSRMIYIVCENCDHDRFNIRDYRQDRGPGRQTVHSLFLAECLECGELYEINISKVRVK